MGQVRGDLDPKGRPSKSSTRGRLSLWDIVLGPDSTRAHVKFNHPKPPTSTPYVEATSRWQHSEDGDRQDNG